MPVKELLIKTSLPMVISMLVQAMYNIVDSIFVAHINEDALTAVSIAFSIQNMIIAVSVGTGVGINALLSKSLGEKDGETVRKTANHAITLYGLTYLVFLILGLTIPEPFLRSQTTSPVIVRYGADYLTIIMTFSLGIFIQICMERLLTSTGQTFYTMVTQTVGAVINIILDPIFIFGYLGVPAMGVKGAAYATVTGQTIAALYAVHLNRKFNPEVKLGWKPKDRKLDGAVVRRIYSIAVPSMAMLSLTSVMVFFMNRILFTFSKTAVALFGAYFKLESIIFMPVFGLTNGMVPIVAYNYGARKRKRISDTVSLSMKYTIVIMIVGVILFTVFPAQLLRFFDASDKMLEIGIPALRIIAIHFVFAGINVVCLSYFQALGDAFISLIIAIGRQLVFVIPISYLLSLTGNLNLVWLSFPISEMISLLMCIYFMRRTNRRKLDFLETAE